MERYQKAFASITVPDDMARRVMARAEESDSVSSAGRSRRWPPILAAAACLLLVLGFAAVHGGLFRAEDPGTMVVNPYVSAQSPEEMAGTLDFPLAVPHALPEGYTLTECGVLSGTVAQLRYEKDGERISFRMARGEEDVSGDYGTYGESVRETVGAWTVTLKGDDGTVSLAVWTGEGFAYALSCPGGLPVETVLAIISGVAPVA